MAKKSEDMAEESVDTTTIPKNEKKSLELKMDKNVPFLPSKAVKKIIVIGCGGTGSYVIPSLMRLLAHSKNKADYQVTLVDGDVVEDKNLIRQNFIQSDIGKNKADALAIRYSGAFGIPITSRDKYIEDAAALRTIIQHDAASVPLIISCVDNVKSRAMIRQMIGEDELSYYWIDCGNEDMAGQVVFSARISNWKYGDVLSGNYPLPDVFDLYPDLWTKLKVDKFASELSCAELAVSSPQHGFVNLTAATFALNYIFSLIQNQPIFTNVVEFSIKNKLVHKTLNLTAIESWKDKMFIYRAFQAKNYR